MNNNLPKIVPVILSGGQGSRLWPMSSDDMPKQFLSLNDPDKSLIEETILRVSDNDIFAPPVIVCNAAHKKQVLAKIEKLGLADYSLILEPCPRNTAPAIALAAMLCGDALMLALPADHIIQKPENLVKAVIDAAKIANDGMMVTFGIKPDAPETGLGYIKCGKIIDKDIYVIDCFVEKPDKETARQYINSGEYLWNSGIFLFNSKHYLSELETYEPDIEALAAKAFDGDKFLPDEKYFAQIKSISVDYAVMERTKNAAVVPIECGWKDIGSWDAFWETKDKDENGNVLIGEAYISDTNNCCIMCEGGSKIALAGLKDMVIVSTPDCVMIAPRKDANSVKKLAEMVKKYE